MGRERGNCNQDIVYEKKSVFSKKEKRKRGKKEDQENRSNIYHYSLGVLLKCLEAEIEQESTFIPMC